MSVPRVRSERKQNFRKKSLATASQHLRALFDAVRAVCGCEELPRPRRCALCSYISSLPPPLWMFVRSRSAFAATGARRQRDVARGAHSPFSTSLWRRGPKRAAKGTAPRVILDEYGIERRPLPPLGLDGKPRAVASSLTRRLRTPSAAYLQEI